MTVKKQNIILLLLLLIPFTNTLGFDLYSHTIAFSYDYDLPSIYKNYYYEDIYFARYLLLSLILEFFGKLSLPIGYVILFLILLPLAQILGSNSELYNVRFKSKTICIIFYFFFALLIVFLTFFYSALSLSMLWALAFFLSRKRIFVIGAFFHPIAVIMYLLISTKKTIKYLLFFSVSFYIFHILYSWFDSSYFYSLSPGSRSIDLKLYDYSIIKTKIMELLIALVFFTFFRTKLTKSSAVSQNVKKAPIGGSLGVDIMGVSIALMTISLIIISSVKNSPINSLFNLESNPVLANAWSFGSTGYDSSELTSSRYK